MHKTMGAEGFSYTSFSSESFRRRFLRKNIPQAKRGRAGGVELYTKCTEKQRFVMISVFFIFGRTLLFGILNQIVPLFRVIRSLILWCFYSLKIHRFLIFIGSRICESSLKKSEQNSAKYFYF